MSKIKVYVETSVWSHLYADDVPEKMAATRAFFDGLKNENYELYISLTVLDEIEKTWDDRREKLDQAINEYTPEVLEVDQTVRDLAEQYVGNGLLTRSHYADVIHIACAAANRIEILLSWNMRHMVNLKTKNIVNGTNQINGYSDLTICTPEELMRYED